MMNRGTGVAASVAAGYLMGRTKKMRLAMMVAAAGLTGRLANKPAEVVRRGAEQLGVSDAAKGITGAAGGNLKTMVKTAAAGMATRRIDALSERVSGGPPKGETDADEKQDKESAKAEGESDEREARSGTGQADKASAKASTKDESEAAADEAAEDRDDGSKPYKPVSRRRSAGANDDDRDEDEGTHRRTPTRGASRTRSRANPSTTQRRTRR